MRKTIAFILSTALMISLLTGCGNKQNSVEPRETTAVVQEETTNKPDSETKPAADPIEKTPASKPEAPAGNYSYDNPVPVGVSHKGTINSEFSDAVYTADVEIKFSDIKAGEEAIKFMNERNLQHNINSPKNELLVVYAEYKYSNITTSNPAKKKVSIYNLAPYEYVISDTDQTGDRLASKFSDGFDYSSFNLGELEVGNTYEFKGYSVYEVPKNSKYIKIGIDKDDRTHTRDNENYIWFSLELNK